MQLHLVLPGLLPGANANGLTAGLATPALDCLLGHARVARSAGMSFEHWLADAFGLPHARAPYAALRRSGERDMPSLTGEWLCADPVHLHLTRKDMLLSDAADLAITDAEAAAIIDGFNDFLAHDEPDFIGFEAGAPTRWYLRLHTPARAAFFPLGDVVGRPVTHFLPAGEQARRWQKISNELQVFLHNHSVNRAREQAGKRTINSVWFWGAGAAPDRLAPPAPCVLADDVLTRGFARAAGIMPEAPRTLPDCDAMMVLDALHRPGLCQDPDTWRSRLLELETRCFAPVVAALKSRRMTRLRISMPGEQSSLTLDIRASDLWKIWQRPRALEWVIDTHS